MARQLLVTYTEGTVAAWGEGFLPRVAVVLGTLGEVRLLDLTGKGQSPLSSVTDLAEVEGLALYAGQLTVACLATAPRLRIVGAISDNRALGMDYAALQARGIPVVDTTRGWAQSVAEVGLNLMLSCLR